MRRQLRADGLLTGADDRLARPDCQWPILTLLMWQRLAVHIASGWSLGCRSGTARKNISAEMSMHLLVERRLDKTRLSRNLPAGNAALTRHGSIRPAQNTDRR